MYAYSFAVPRIVARTPSFTQIGPEPDGLPLTGPLPISLRPDMIRKAKLADTVGTWDAVSGIAALPTTRIESPRERRVPSTPTLSSIGFNLSVSLPTVMY